MTTDVLVIGGGPAGSSAAISARMFGLNVLLLEQASSFRGRPGETLPPGVEGPLRRLGAWDRIERERFITHEGHWVEWDGARVFAAYGRDQDGPWRGLQACRPIFDAILLARASELGAVVLRPCRALAPLIERGRVLGAATSQGPLRAKLTIDASGGAGWLGRWCDVSPRVETSPLVVRYGYARGHCPARDEAPLLKSDDDGWTWTARVRNDDSAGSEEGAVYAWVRLNLLEAPVGPKWLPRELCRLRPIGASRGRDVTWRYMRAPAGVGYFMAGDAAGVMDPSTSHGVLRALLTGMTAGRYAAASLAGADPAASRRVYSQWLISWFQDDMTRLRSLYRRRWPAGQLTWASSASDDHLMCESLPPDSKSETSPGER